MNWIKVTPLHRMVKTMKRGGFPVLVVRESADGPKAIAQRDEVKDPAAEGIWVELNCELGMWNTGGSR